jgi:ferritin-like metal-binding protein YciE
MMYVGVSGCWRWIVMVHCAFGRSRTGMGVFALRAHLRRAQSEDQSLGADDHPRGDTQTTPQAGEHAFGSYRIEGPTGLGLLISCAAQELRPPRRVTSHDSQLMPVKEIQMAAETLHELFVEELRDMYDGEKRIIKALPKLARHARSDELRTALTEHLRQTEKQATRLEQVFRTIGETPRGKKCDGIIGILEEGRNAIEELEEGPVLDAALIAGCQKVEHYEIASYGTLAYFAELMGHDRARELLGTTLDEEKAADEKLNTIAKSDVNRDALMADADMEEEDVESSGRPRRRMMAMANERPSRTRSSAARRRKSSRRQRR